MFLTHLHNFSACSTVKCYCDNIDYRDNYSDDISWHEILLSPIPTQVISNILHLSVLNLINVNMVPYIKKMSMVLIILLICGQQWIMHWR